MLARSAQRLGSGKRLGDASLKRVAWRSSEALGPRLALLEYGWYFWRVLCLFWCTTRYAVLYHTEQSSICRYDAFDTENLLCCMEKLRHGLAVNVPNYDFKSHKRKLPARKRYVSVHQQTGTWTAWCRAIPLIGVVYARNRSVKVDFDHHHPLKGSVSLAAAREKEEKGEEKGKSRVPVPLSLDDLDPPSPSLAGLSRA
ncbi:hypothetical protein BHE74_00013443 [Ensete ventricosum]|nr:hypothetical protein GW17_00051474 [Ensete ventricosum]RWW78350.1 hypothetical protein BHE74_00013443 [Ensete ventricosum]